MVLSLLKDIFDLAYPHLCLGCEEEAIQPHDLFCIHCESTITVTDFHLHDANEAVRRVLGGVPIHFGSSMYRFFPGGIIQNLIHQIKYERQTYAALSLGRSYGKALSNVPKLHNLDVIVPVPLHKKRQIKRGYNQSLFFARGLAESMRLKVDTSVIKRIKDTQTQTDMNKAERLENMSNAFQYYPRKLDLTNKHVLFVDDVLTTGATILSCAEVLKSVPGVKVSFATIALAQ